MNSKVLYLATFALGAAAGAFGAWRYLEAKYEALVDEEIKSIRETLIKKEETTEEETIEDSEEDSAQKEQNNYTNLTKLYSESKKVDIPYVIKPHDFGEFDDYETITLSYYADRVLADEFDNIVEDVDDMVGYEALRHFGEFEEDVVHVRNDARKCDYEICRDVRRYSEVAGV